MNNIKLFEIEETTCPICGAKIDRELFSEPGVSEFWCDDCSVKTTFVDRNVNLVLNNKSDLFDIETIKDLFDIETINAFRIGHCKPYSVRLFVQENLEAMEEIRKQLEFDDSMKMNFSVHCQTGDDIPNYVIIRKRFARELVKFYEENFSNVENKKLKRYRFKTKSVDDFRPLIDMSSINMPWWSTGESGDGKYATIVCYLPPEEDLMKYWDDAYDIDVEDVEEIKYSSRFPKPDWVKGE